jgi:exopolysaccharide biosynthesis polyprenyl glycosylphosphotransferase
VSAPAAGRQGRLRREWLERLSLVAVDVAAFALGLRLAYLLYRITPLEEAAESPLVSFESLGRLVATQVVVMGGVFFFHQLYHQPHGVSRVDLLARVVRAVSIGIILTYFLTSLVFPDLDYSRVLPVYDWLTTVGCVAALRLMHRAAWGVLRGIGVGRLRVLVVGAGPIAQDLVSRIHRHPWLGYEVVGLVDDTPGRALVRGVPVIGRTAELGRIVDELAVDEVLIALPDASRAQLVALVSQCDRDGLSIRVFPDVFEIIASGVEISDLDGMPLLTMRNVALRGWRRTLKRVVDIAISLSALVLLSPLLLVVAILVKIESRGAAFYVQERMGFDARPFPILKFRSMREGAERETGAVWARRDDPRRTRVGQFLRRSNLDEFPQLINVLLGHMSIVGPRPERPQFVAEFRRRIPRYMERHREKAGLTGWAQVNGLRGDTSIEERTKYDLYYIENWSLLFDFKIMAKTVMGGFRDPNAY